MNKLTNYFILLLCFITLGCESTKVIRRHIKVENFNEPSSKIKVIKLYMKDGSLYVLDNWIIEDSIDIIHGEGLLYDVNRNLVSRSADGSAIQTQQFKNIRKDDISIIETNELTGHMANMLGITLPGVPFSVLSAYCLANPKACFGSCPTFYTQTDQNWNLTAEGFSSSILPSFEKRDIDKLYLAESEDTIFNLKLTNEALETHAIRYANILAFPKQANRYIFSTTDNRFFSVENMVAPTTCTDQSGDCLDMIVEMDDKERFSLSNPNNLLKKEELILTFNTKSKAAKGLIINSRQTLLTTYLFYQSMAYSGNYYGLIAAEVENGNTWIKDRFFKNWERLGGIEIYIRKPGGWKLVDEVDEMGPIASDFHLIELPEQTGDKITIKLRMTQGLWRMNYLALADLYQPEDPLTLYPESIIAENLPQQNQFDQLCDTSTFLFTFPGDKYLLSYQLPDNREYEYFLDTKGYYIEWMREEWKQEEDMGKLKLMFVFPGIYFRKMAKDFKKAEPLMEDSFWNSRYELTRNNRIMFETPRQNTY